MNKVMLIGRLGKDPELRYSTTGSPIANLRIATDESYIDRDGNKVDRTEWHTVVVFQRQAESCQTYLKKGSLVYVEGSLQTRKWQDKQGQDRYTTEVRSTRVVFLDRKGEVATTEDNTPHYQPHREFSRDKGGVEDFDRAFPSVASAMDDVPF